MYLSANIVDLALYVSNFWSYQAISPAQEQKLVSSVYGYVRQVGR